ncbi:hypothetical protein OLMES_0256 [Oleiphilus messinensis]|uniref:Uncharacterized protein n=1 Tax=Oleiphilus messinensis TaxID=141451 RepID=A0A1Y0I1N8_9GAMM|nr:hypothetical protein OLMES_0256 [Oleiphilus messinensis]
MKTLDNHGLSSPIETPFLSLADQDRKGFDYLLTESPKFSTFNHPIG